MKWSEDQFEALKGLIDQGLTASQIGNELGVTRNAIIGKVHRGGLAFISRQGPVQKREKRSRAARCQSATAVKIPSPRPPGRTELPPENPAAAVSLIKLAAHHCRWPAGGDPMRYCGADRVAGSSYCARHEWIAHHGSAA